MIDYYAMNGDDSDGSDDDFQSKKNVIKKTPISSVSAAPKKTTKVNKLKLATRRETKEPIVKQNDDQSSFTKLKPKKNEVDEFTPTQVWFFYYFQIVYLFFTCRISILHFQVQILCLRLIFQLLNQT